MSVILMTSVLFLVRWVITQLISQKLMLSYKYHLILVRGVKKLSGWDVFSGQRYFLLMLLTIWSILEKQIAIVACHPLTFLISTDTQVSFTVLLLILDIFFLFGNRSMY